MRREKAFVCPDCGKEIRIPEPGNFLATTYAGACLSCHGMGTTTVPKPEKLIVNPEKPLCGGAMYSPGFFPYGYICKPFNWGHYIFQALADRHGFDPATTPWNKMTPEAQQAFLFGDPEPMEVHYENRAGQTSSRKARFKGFYGWVRDWDFFGTYTDQVTCHECHGGGLRPDYLAVTLGGYHMSQLGEMPLSRLLEVLQGVDTPERRTSVVAYNLATALRCTRFLLRVGLGYLNIKRRSFTLSAGEAQRIRLAGLLGSGMRHLTVLVDEPSRGLHPSEVGALASALGDLRDEGNTVVVVEHDPVLIGAADHLIDMGPGPGVAGGNVVATGRPDEMAGMDTPTGRWLGGKGSIKTVRPRRSPRGWMTVRGARGNNLRGEDLGFPLGTVTGVCGVSGSGKSTLITDTIGRVLAPKKQTTSVATEPVHPQEHDGIEGGPGRTVLVDQAKQGVTSPADFLGIESRLRTIFAESDDAKSMGPDQDVLRRGCSACGGRGDIRIDMGFLPAVHTPCESCEGTGYPKEARQIRIKGVSLPDLLSLTMDEVHGLFGDKQGIGPILETARAVGLGYLVLRQPGFALSGGEAQRLKIARELCRKVPAETLYILDEPTVGQHMEDVARLATVLHSLAERGHTVVVVEHQPHLLASCDWLVELGPGGGPDGGKIVAQGTPEEVAQGDTPSARFIKEALEAGA
jgi:excinuclease ABC subunit A